MFDRSTDPSCRDALTGLNNRQFLYRRFPQLTAEISQLGIILVDIDGLIHFNDRYGHLKADEFLITIGNLLSQNIPPATEIGRSAGDEFIIFLTGLQMGAVVAIAIQLCQIIKNHFAHLPPIDRTYFFPDRSKVVIQRGLTISCGIAFYPHHGTELATLYEAADLAMLDGGKHFHGGRVAIAKFPNTAYAEGDR